MECDLQAVVAWMARAETEELLDRITVYRDQLELAAYDLFRGELARRNISEQEIEDHRILRRERWISRPDGSTVPCWKCPRPAVARVRSWWKLLGIVPVFPLVRPVCSGHE